MYYSKSIKKPIVVIIVVIILAAVVVVFEGPLHCLLHSNFFTLVLYELSNVYIYLLTYLLAVWRFSITSSNYTALVFFLDLLAAEICV